jgi:hypothetical protein
MKTNLPRDADKSRVLCGWRVQSTRYLNGVADLHGPQMTGAIL